MLRTLSLSLHLLRKTFHTSSCFMIFFSVLLAVSAMSGLQFYTERLIKGLEQQSTKLLGGDLVISSSQPISIDWLKEANTLGLRTAMIWIYPSIIGTKNHFQLVNIQAVSKNYPLLSQPLALHNREVLIDPQLIHLMSTRLGDQIKIGAIYFKIHALLPSEMEMLNTGLFIAPRILIKLEDVSATQTVIPGSRVDYRLLLTGHSTALKKYRNWLSTQLAPGQKIFDIHNQRFVLRDTLLRTLNYIQLIIIFCLLLSGIVIFLSTYQYLKQHYRDIALWRCFGASKNQIILLISLQLICIAMSAGLLGIGIGWGLQQVFAQMFKDFFYFLSPTVSLQPAAIGLLTSFFLILAFAYPLLIDLPRTPPVYLLRKEIKHSNKNIHLSISLGCLFFYIFFIMHFSLLALLVLDLILLSMGILYLLTQLSIFFLRKIMNKTRGIIRRGLGQLVYYPISASLQLSALTSVLMTLFILNNIRLHLFSDWQQSLSKDTPNYFVFNISAQDSITIKKILEKNHIKIQGIYPMVRGRLIKLNDQPIITAVKAASRSHNALHRELNLSAMINYPSDNKVMAGKIIPGTYTGKPIISVENSLADELGLKIGDNLTFQIGEQQLSAKIINFRKVNWESFHPNFYIIFNHGALQNFIMTYITSFYLPPEKLLTLRQLVQILPNATVIDIAALLTQIQELIKKIILALEYLFVFMLGLAILIFIITLLANMDERRQTYSLLHILGATQKYIIGTIIIEFTILIILTFIFSEFLSTCLLYFLTKQFF